MHDVPARESIYHDGQRTTFYLDIHQLEMLDELELFFKRDLKIRRSRSQMVMAGIEELFAGAVRDKTEHPIMKRLLAMPKPGPGLGSRS